VGPTFHDVREVMVEGPSGLKAIVGKSFRPRWQASRRRLVWPNGAMAYAFSADGHRARAFWRLSLAEWRALTSVHSEALSRAAFEDLARRFPDKDA